MQHQLYLWLVLTSLLIISGCQSMNAQPDGRGKQPQGNAIELRNKAHEAYNEGNWAEAKQALVALTQEIPQEAEPWFRLGNVYARLEQPRQAVAAYQEALIREPEHNKAWHNMGIIQLRQAINSFSQLQSATEPGNELHERAQILIDAVSRVLENNFDAGPEQPVR